MKTTGKHHTLIAIDDDGNELEVRPIPVKDLPEWQKGWLAGIIDGEGTINVVDREKHGGRPLSAVRVGMTDEATMQLVFSLMGCGSLSFRPMRKHQKPVWDWGAFSLLDVVDILEALLPYLITKQEKASIVLQYARKRIAGITNVTEDKEIVRKMALLNKKGTEDEGGEDT